MGPFDVKGGGVIVIDQGSPLADVGNMRVVKSPTDSKPKTKKKKR